jgi:hypothetical protein
MMSDESLEKIERQISLLRGVNSPVELRGVVLEDVRRELRSARWDRRMTRLTAALLVVGVGINLMIGLRSGTSHRGQLAGDRQTMARTSLVDTAVLVAEATDATTARRFARQMAAMAGRPLTEDDAAAIDAAVLHRASKDTI